MNVVIMEAIPSTSFAGLDEAAGSDNQSDVNNESDGDAESSDDEETVKCPICLLKIKGQIIGLPEVCGHHFCLDCIQEWSKLTQTCPYDRRQFTNILVKSTLDGEVVRTIPILPAVLNNDLYDEDILVGPFAGDGEEVVVVPGGFNQLHLDACQSCGMIERPNMMLFCYTCDDGYHMDCLNPPLENMPTGNWFCHQCNVIPAPPPQFEQIVVRPPEQRELEIEAVVRPQMEIVRPVVRQQRETVVPVERQLDRNGRDLRTVVRLIVERNRQMIALNSTADVGRAFTVYEPRLPVREPTIRKKQHTVSTSRPRNKTKSSKSFGLQREPTSTFSLFGNSNTLDEPYNDNDDESVYRKLNAQLCPPKKKTQSALAKLAESRIVKRPISYGHLVQPRTTPTKPPVPSTIYSGNCDLLSTIMASQSKLKDFGKTSESPSQQKKEDSNAIRMRAAIIASQAILDRFDEDRKNRQIALNDSTDYRALNNYRIPKLPKSENEAKKSSSQNLPGNSVKTPPLSKKKRLEKLENCRKRMLGKLRSDTQMNPNLE